MAMSRAKKVSEKRAHKRSPRRSEQIFPSALLGDAEIPYSLSHKWRAINETTFFFVRFVAWHSAALFFFAV